MTKYLNAMCDLCVFIVWNKESNWQSQDEIVKELTIDKSWLVGFQDIWEKYDKPVNDASDRNLQKKKAYL